MVYNLMERQKIDNSNKLERIIIGNNGSTGDEVLKSAGRIG